MIRSRFEPIIRRYCYTTPFAAAPLDMKVRYWVRGSLQLTHHSQSSLQRQLSMHRRQKQSTQWGRSGGWPYTPMRHSRYFPFRKEKHLLFAMLHIATCQVQRSVTPGDLPISHDDYNGTYHAQFKVHCLWSQRTRVSRL